jgi:cell shape-determining protein MreD
MRGTSRLLAALVAVIGALLVQAAVLPQVAPLLTWHGIGPGLVLLVVVGAALVTDPRFATLLGFGAGLLLDLAPPADHVAGRWALALLVVGYVVSRLAHDHQPAASPLDAESERRPPLPVVLAAAAGGSFVGNSAFALTGVVLRDPAVGVGDLLQVVAIGLVWDVVAAVVVVPVTVLLFSVLARPHRVPRVTPRTPRRQAPVG